MIRLPPTSISLSERDIDLHLQQARLICGLRKQGSKKEDIDRYLKNDREVPAESTCQAIPGLDLLAFSALELNDDPIEETKPRLVHSSSTSSTSVSTIPFPEFPPELCGKRDGDSESAHLSNHQAQVAEDDGRVSGNFFPPTMHTDQHAPRKSSLLRFAQAVSPERRPTGTDTSSVSETQFASPPRGDDSEDSPTLPFIRPDLGRRRSSSPFGRPFSNTDVPSSPPLPRTPARRYSRQSQSSSGSFRPPTTPTPTHGAIISPRTVPHHYRNQLDGNSFSVYNDSLPAISQPQTPADLSRHPLITEHDAAYTAPPGMVRSARGHRQGWERESGEQSPTARAITLRERRNRELARSVRAEGARLERLRMRDEAMFTRRAFETAAAANGGGLAEAMLPVTGDIWREDLDADRVGEENFDTDPEVNGRQVMRTVSGNARFEWEGAFDR